LDFIAGRAGRHDRVRPGADRHQAAIVYANGGKFDKSFNEGVSNGAKKFTDETKIAVADFEPCERDPVRAGTA